MLDTLLEHALKEWAVISEAPIAFLLCVAFAAVLIFVGVEWFHGERSATQEERNKLLAERLDEARLSLKTTAEAGTKPLVDTAHLKLHLYGDDRIPSKISVDNVWRWFYLRLIATGIEKETGKEFRQDVITTLFVSFDRRVSVGTLEISSPDIRLPLHEVKEFNNRFAIIVFNGNLPQGTLDLGVHS